jgi:hypothetical protein
VEEASGYPIFRTGWPIPNHSVPQGEHTKTHVDIAQRACLELPLAILGPGRIAMVS